MLDPFVFAALEMGDRQDDQFAHRRGKLLPAENGAAQPHARHEFGARVRQHLHYVELARHAGEGLAYLLRRMSHVGVGNQRHGMFRCSGPGAQ